MNENLLRKLRAQGIYWYPGLPNTTTGCSDTRDKSLFCENLNQMTDDALEKQRSVTLNMVCVGDLVFGVRGDRSVKYKAAYYALAEKQSNMGCSWCCTTH